MEEIVNNTHAILFSLTKEQKCNRLVIYMEVLCYSRQLQSQLNLQCSKKVSIELLPLNFITLYNKCQECILFVGTAAYDKLTSLLSNKLLLKDIGKLSPDAQTSCLEGFHATLNHWHPKMTGFSWLGTFCRYHDYVWYYLRY